jgi:hypothetical protein
VNVTLLALGVAWVGAGVQITPSGRLSASYVVAVA